MEQQEGGPGGPGPTRRRFLSGAAATAGTAALVAAGAGTASATPRPDPHDRGLPPPEASGIDHIVVVMMENRSFDHYLGWLPGADGRQAGLRYPDRMGALQPTHHLTDPQNCTHADPDHSFEGGRSELNGGRCDGWLRTSTNDDLCIGYYTAADLAFYRYAAPYWTTCDRYFSAIMAETYPNRFYQHAAQTDRIHNSTAIATIPTIWDRLKAAGRTGRYFYSDSPFTALWGTKYLDISRPYAEFLTAATAGTLPDFCLVDPRFLDEDSGTSADDHPHADIRAGQSFLDQVYRAVTTSPAWSRTLLIINYDEWGGFFDHVAPATAPDAHPEWGLRGFRVPALVISPRARRHHVAHDVYDHASVLKAAEWRWNLPPLTPRDAAARNIAEVLDFSRPPDLTAPTAPVPFVMGTPCQVGNTAADFEQWTALRDLARAHGWSFT